MEERTERLVDTSEQQNIKQRNRILIIAAVVLVVLAAAGAWYYFFMYPTSLTTQADTAMSDKKYDEAEQLYKRIIGIDGKNYNAYVKLGEIYTDQNKFDEAVSILTDGTEKVKDKTQLIKLYSKLIDASVSDKKTDAQMTNLYSDAYEATNDDQFKTYKTGSSSSSSSSSSGTHRYEIVIGDITWLQAQQSAKDKGGYLATLDTDTEMNTVINQIKASGHENGKFYIGGSRTSDGRDYRWIDKNGNYYGSVLNQSTHWLTGDPSFSDPNAQGDNKNEAYMMLYYYDNGGTWNWVDVPNNVPSAVPVYAGKVGFIVEYES